MHILEGGRQERLSETSESGSQHRVNNLVRVELLYKRSIIRTYCVLAVMPT